MSRKLTIVAFGGSSFPNGSGEENSNCALCKKTTHTHTKKNHCVGGKGRGCSGREGVKEGYV